MVFMLISLVMLLNILIAQLSDSYQRTRSDVQYQEWRKRTRVVAETEENTLCLGFKVRDHMQSVLQNCKINSQYNLVKNMQVILCINNLSGFRILLTFVIMKIYPCKRYSLTTVAF